MCGSHVGCHGYQRVRYYPNVDMGDGMKETDVATEVTNDGHAFNVSMCSQPLLPSSD